LIVVVAMVAMVAMGLGCAEDPVEIESGICVEQCIDRRLKQLSSIDHETPTAEAVKMLHDSCMVTRNPCCVDHRGRRVSCRANGISVAPAQPAVSRPPVAPPQGDEG
jgi:hypothetical protein